MVDTAEETAAKEKTEVERGYWFRTCYFVMKHPLIFLAVLLGLLAGLMYVFIDKVRLGNNGVYLLPVDSTIKRTYSAIARDIPAGGGSSLEVFMESRSTLVTSPAFLTALDAYTTDIERFDSVDSVRNLVRMKDGFTIPDYASSYASVDSVLSKNVLSPFFISNLQLVSRTTIYLKIGAYDDAIPDLIRSIRSINRNSAVSTYLSDVAMTGEPAANYDINRDVGGVFPYLIAVVVCAMFVLLFLLSGSILVPIQAIITAVLSLVASLGFLVLIFQDGPENAKDLLDFENSGTLDPLILLFIFGVSFGLSLDYEGKLFLNNIHTGTVSLIFCSVYAWSHSRDLKKDQRSRVLCLCWYRSFRKSCNMCCHSALRCPGFFSQLKGSAS